MVTNYKINKEHKLASYAQGMTMIIRTTAAFVAAGVLAVSPASAKSPAEFFKGKTIKFLVGYNPGGGYDTYSRILSKHYGRFIPGKPTFVVQNMPGAGSRKATNYIYSVAPKDGTVMGMISRNMPLLGILGGKKIKFDPRKFTWLGSSSSGSKDAYILWYRTDTGVKSIKEAIGPNSKQLILGSTAPGSTGTDVPRIMRDTIGLNIKMILGYRGSDDLFLAITRGEIKGRTVGLSSVRSNQAEWMDRKLVRPLVQFARETRHPDFKDVPTARELAKDEAALKLIKFAEGPFQFARPVAAPPGIPADRAKVLRAAFMKTHEDAAYLADAKKIGIAVDPIGGEKVAQLIVEIAQAGEVQKDYMRKLYEEGRKAKKARKKKKKKKQ